MTTKYVASPQIRMVPSKEKRGSAVVHYDPQLVRVHAVASVDGVSAELTACRRFRSEVEDPEWSFDSVEPEKRCEFCANALGMHYVA